MTVSSRTDRSAFARTLIEDRRRMQDQDHQKEESAINYQRVVGLKGAGKSCKTCAAMVEVRFFHLCRQQNMKQIKPYNICHRYED